MTAAAMTLPPMRRRHAGGAGSAIDGRWPRLSGTESGLDGHVAGAGTNGGSWCTSAVAEEPGEYRQVKTIRNHTA